MELIDTLPPEKLKLASIDINDQLVALEEMVMCLEKDPTDKESLNHAFRATHSIKGVAAMFGLERIRAITHHAEDVLDLVRKGDIAFTTDIAQLTLNVHDVTCDILNNGGKNTQKEDEARIIATLKGYLDNRSTGKVPLKVVAAMDEAHKVSKALYWIRFRFNQENAIFEQAIKPELYLKMLRKLGECNVTLRSDNLPDLKSLNPGICYVFWDVSLLTDRTEQQIRKKFQFIEDDLVELKIQRAPQSVQGDHLTLGEILVQRGDLSQDVINTTLSKQPLLGKLLEESGEVNREQIASALAGQALLRKNQPASDTDQVFASVRVTADKLDSLVDQVGELVIVQARLQAIALRPEFEEDQSMQIVAEEIAKLAETLRDSTMDMRMFPIATIFGRYHRMVRDLARELGKKMVLVTHGDDTALDKSILERMNDPLVHLIRNCGDHGIETPGERTSAGKDPIGRIELSASHVGAYVIIRIHDDGRGMDPAIIREKAVRSGLIVEDAALTHAEIFALTFQPGFSTKEAVTSISGRGVGMDVVKRNVESMRGNIEVESEPGIGSTVTIKLPLTVAIIDGFLVSVGGQRFVVPLTSVSECVILTQEDTACVNGKNLIKLRDEVVPFIRLSDLFHLERDNTDQEYMVIADSDLNPVGLVVDQILGKGQMVIKSLGDVFHNVPVFSGATILGDGYAAPILDVEKIIEKMMVSDSN